MTGADLHVTAAARLRADGQRYTSNRKVLVEVLSGSDRPLTIHEILDRRSEVAQSSAYRNLAVLERAGVVHRVVTHDEFARYELAEELTDHHHHHLVCSECGAVADFSMPEGFEERLDAELEKAARRAGFATEGHRLDLVGRCRNCRDARG
ncbi:MAG TPA: Fur family transcriptional regulator [Acidimicrobiia bacterium]|nr:Fur family transcriptional regulator [Acidimicrobiia bacterium]